MNWKCIACAVALLTGVPGLAGARPAVTPSIRVIVDPRIELMSIVFRLAGHPEYSVGAIESYTKDVDTWFAKFRDHAVVARARRLRQARGIAYNAPMGLAVNLTPLPELAEKVPFDPLPPGIDRRWTPGEARAFLADLRAFVRDADVARFLADHEPLYRAAVGRFEAAIGPRDLAEWFDTFFNVRDGRRLTIAIALLNGGGNYGAIAHEPGSAAPGTPASTAPTVEEVFAILGAAFPDSNDLPTFPRDQVGVLVHEFCHAFVNPVVEAHEREFGPAAAKIYPLVENEMRAAAYGSATVMVIESLVRACTVRYLAARVGTDAAQRQAAADRGGGFAWVGRIAELLAQYERARTKFPTVEAFVPRLAAFFDDYGRVAAADIAAARAEAQAMAASRQEGSPRVLSTTPANNAQEVDAAEVTAITVTFDRRMNGGFAVVAVPGSALPRVTASPRYGADLRVLTIPCQLQPGSAYGLQLNSPEYMVIADGQGQPLSPFVLRFKTKK